MFARLLWKLLRGSRGRLTVALIALVSGAAVISALLNLDLDIERKLTQEFRLLGANLVISGGTPRSDNAGTATTYSAAPTLMDANVVLKETERLKTQDVVAEAPYLYVVARAGNRAVVTAGTWLDEVHALNPTWKIEGELVTSRQDEQRCLIGQNVARQFKLAPGGSLELNYLGHNKRVEVAGMISSGSTEDDQIFVNLPVVQNLAGLDGKIELVQLSVAGTSEGIERYAARLSRDLPGYDVRPIRQVTQAEGQLLDRTRLLIVSMVILILALTALCVLGTMAALALERREDVGLMKALGGSISRIMGLFLAEVGVLGAAGGLIGSIAGILLSQWMGQRVFGTTITPRWEIFPLTIALMTGVALAGALPLRLLGKVKPAVILRGE